MKTAMQELIDTMTDKKRRMQLSLDLGLFRKSAYSQLILPAQIDAMGDAIKLAQSMLEKEKEHFICYSLGYLEVHQFVHPDEFYNTFINFEDDNINTNEK